MAVILFLILVMLLYATGLLPGVIQLISAFLILMLLMYAKSIYGWTVVIGGFVSAIAFAVLTAWLAIYWYKRIAKSDRQRDEAHRKQQIEKALEKRAQERESKKQKAIREQIDITDSIGKR